MAVCLTLRYRNLCDARASFMKWRCLGLEDGYPEVLTMTHPLDKATSTAPPTLGEGCLSRYDPDALTPDDGADFDGAAELWRTTLENEQPQNDTSDI